MVVEKTFQTTDIGSIPKDWVVVPLNKMTSLMTNGFVGTVKSNYTDSEDGVLYIQGYNVEENAFNFKGIKRVTKQFHKQHSKSCLKENDLLTIQTGDVGLTTIVPKELEGSNCHALIITRFKPRYCSKFFAYYFNSSYGRLRLKEIETGTTMKHINVGDLLHFSVPVPTETEQTAIATALSDADALIASLEKLIAKKRLIKQGVMQKLLEPKKGWNSDLTKNLASINTGSRNTQDRVEDGMYHFFVRSDTVERIDSYSFDGEAILVAGDGVGTGKVIHYFNGKFDYHQRVYKISGFSERISGYFFYLYFKRNFLNRIMQMTAKSSVDSVRLDMIADMTIPFPSRDEQDSIVQVLMDSESEINVLETRLQKIRSVKQGMMQTLLTGKIRLV